MSQSQPAPSPTPELTLSAVCGLFCPSCSVYIATKEDPARLQALAAKFACSVDDMVCHGCRSERRALHCRQHCEFIECAARHKVDFCGQCPEYPCEALRTFQSRMPHRLELWDSHQRLREVGPEAWYGDMVKRYACEGCKTINSAYDLKCRACGAQPSNGFVAAHGEAVKAFLSRGGL